METFPCERKTLETVKELQGNYMCWKGSKGYSPYTSLCPYYRQVFKGFTFKCCSCSIQYCAKVLNFARNVGAVVYFNMCINGKTQKHSLNSYRQERFMSCVMSLLSFLFLFLNNVTLRHGSSAVDSCLFFIFRCVTTSFVLLFIQISQIL